MQQLRSTATMWTVKPGERVYVETPLFSGWARVVGVHEDSRDLYPIAIELEDGDDEGHSYKRISIHDVRRQDDGVFRSQFEEQRAEVSDAGAK